jgi:hypothetical protein
MDALCGALSVVIVVLHSPQVYFGRAVATLLQGCSMQSILEICSRCCLGVILKCHLFSSSICTRRALQWTEPVCIHFGANTPAVLFFWVFFGFYSFPLRFQLTLASPLWLVV